MNVDLRLGDCLDKLKELEDNSIDSIVTDPPYGLSFMNKKWDYDVPSIEVWTECLRVLKPGGHLLSFSGSRTYHRMAVRIEDAGFEIRDQIMWVYGSGFPKSHNIGKAVDKLMGNEREVVGTETTPYKVKGKDDEGVTWDNKTFCSNTDENGYRINTITKGQSEWEGWGTALKPAHEPIVVARKPLSEKSVVENVLKWGTGGLNIDDCRVGYKDDKPHSVSTIRENEGNSWNKDYNRTEDWQPNNTGRWPANIMFDEEAAEMLDNEVGITEYNKKRKPGNYKGGHRKEYVGTDNNPIVKKVDGNFYSDKGGPSRFFYVPKASKKDRDEGMDNFPDYNKYEDTCSDNHSFSHLVKEGKEVLVKNIHPTVKPTQLMLYLIKLVTPKGGVVLDPFMGSGSTGKAAIRGGYSFIGMEKEEEYINIAKARIENEYKHNTN